MNNDKLKLITVIKSIIDKVYKSLLNCPKEHLELKKIFINEILGYLKLVYIANDISDSNKRRELKERIIYETKYISSLINILYDNKLISHKLYLELGSDFDLLIKLLKGWVKI